MGPEKSGPRYPWNVFQGCRREVPSSSAPSLTRQIQIDPAGTYKVRKRGTADKQTDTERHGAGQLTSRRWVGGPWAGVSKSRTSPHLKDPRRVSFRWGDPAQGTTRPRVRMQSARGLFRYTGTRGDRVSRGTCAPPRLRSRVYIG